MDVPSYVFRHNKTSIWYFRYVIPKHLREQVKKREIRKSLGTRDKKLALHRARLMLTNIMEATVNGIPIRIDRKDPNEEFRLFTDALKELQGQSKPLTTSISLSKVIEKYSSEREFSGTWSLRARAGNKIAFRWLLEAIGDMPINSFDHDTSRKYKEALIQRKLKPSTVNYYLGCVVSLINWCNGQGYVTGNPVKGMKLPINEKTTRKIFTQTDLDRLFAPRKKYLHSYYYWLPRLGLYTGARINELCSLELNDIYEESGIWVIHIHDSEDKKLKTEHSQRVVPIHSYIISIGFLDHVKELKRQGHTRLFPELKKDRHGYSNMAVKWFTRYRRKVGVDDPNKPFHSFRHTFTDTLKQRGVPYHISAALDGHSDGSITFGTYGRDFNVGILKDAVERIDFKLPKQTS